MEACLSAALEATREHASARGFLRRFGMPGVGACRPEVRHGGASLSTVEYSTTGINVVKATPYLRPKGLGEQEHGAKKAEGVKYLNRVG